MTDQTASAGATPVVTGATPAQTSPATTGTPPPAAPAAAPATGAADDAALGDAGREALRRERDARAAAERDAKTAKDELEKLRAASLSESEKAIADAKRAGADEARTQLHGALRSSEVIRALTTAGLSPSLATLAARGDEFAALKVSDSAQVEGLPEAVAAFREANKDLFRAAPPPSAPGSFDTGTGAGGRPAGKPTYTREQLRDATFFAANKDDILAAQREGRIIG